jgi:hypothetical protein
MRARRASNANAPGVSDGTSAIFSPPRATGVSAGSAMGTPLWHDRNPTERTRVLHGRIHCKRRRYGNVGAARSDASRSETKETGEASRGTSKTDGDGDEKLKVEYDRFSFFSKKQPKARHRYLSRNPNKTSTSALRVELHPTQTSSRVLPSLVITRSPQQVRCA